MPLTNYWNFLKNLRRGWSSGRPVRRPANSVQRNLSVASATECLEVRIVPAGQPALSITPTVTVAEGDSDTTAAVFTVTLSAASTETVAVNYSTLDETATEAGADYVGDFGTLTFAPGETSKTISIDVNGDTTHESDETFSVVLFSPTNAKLRDRDAMASGTITNDDAAPTVSIGTPDIVFEGNTDTSVVSFPVTLTNPSDQTVTVHFATSDDTATTEDDDYVAKSGTVTFAPGETTRNVTVTINGDTTVESDETFTVTLSAATNTTITTDTATATIGDDDTTPTLSVNNPAAINEGNTGTVTVLFTITLSSASTSTVTVAYTTADGTATEASNDYETNSGMLTFAPGQTSKIVSVVVNGDTLSEANETILLNLSAPTNANLAMGTGTATITNDDAGQQPTISITPGVAVTEGNDGTVEATFHVTLSQASGETVTVAIATANGTATLADNDYVQASGTITFAPGETDKTFVVQVNGDTKLEGDETFTVNLTSAVNATIATPQRSGTITNDDGGFVSIARTTDGAETTPPSKGRFTVTQSGVSSQNTVITYTIEGTATPGEGSDYEELTGTVTIPAGQTTATIDVTPFNDEEDEDTETVIVTLTGFTSHDPSVELDPDAEDLTATVEIVDASEVPGLAVGGPAVTYTKKGPPVSVLPLVTVNDVPLGGGVLSISVNAVGTARKLFDKFKFPSTSGLGMSNGPQRTSNLLNLTIDLNQGATAAAIQAFLRAITFSTKGDGLQTATRTLQVTLTDATNHTSAITQTINVQESATP